MENTPVVEEVVVPKKNVLFEVTPASRVLAGVLFIALPFIGGWIGYTYGNNNSITEVSPTIQPQTPPQIVTPKSTSEVDVVTDMTIQGELNDILFKGQKTGYTTDGEMVYFSQIEGNTNDEWVLSKERILVEGADAKTFEVIASEPAQVGSLYAIDANHAYAFEKRLPDVDPKTVEVFSKGGAFLISNAGLFLGGELEVNIDKTYAKVYLAELSEGASPYTVYIHDTKNDLWFSNLGIKEGKAEAIEKPSQAELGIIMYPSSVQ